MKSILKTLPGTLLILLFVYAAISKWADPQTFHDHLYNQPFKAYFANFLFYFLPLSELLAAGLLMTNNHYRTGLWLSLGLLTVFTGYIILIKLHFYHRIPCSCGGVIDHLSWTGHLFLNLFFIALTSWALHQELRGKPKTFEKSRPHLFT